MNQARYSLLLPATLLIVTAASGCTPTPAKDAAANKSVQEIAQEAMNSKGKLSKEQIDALIRANAACRPDDKT